MPDRTWNYEGYDPAQERLRESLCTLGNGYFATAAPPPRRRPAPRTIRGPTRRAATTG